jgi:hypothetical protein
MHSDFWIAFGAAFFGLAFVVALWMVMMWAAINIVSAEEATEERRQP